MLFGFSFFEHLTEDFFIDLGYRSLYKMFFLLEFFDFSLGLFFDFSFFLLELDFFFNQLFHTGLVDFLFFKFLIDLLSVLLNLEILLSPFLDFFLDVLLLLGDFL